MNEPKVHKTRYLTDTQWIALIGLVNDDQEYVVTYPGREGESAYVQMPDKTHREVKADGEIEDA